MARQLTTVAAVCASLLTCPVAEQDAREVGAREVGAREVGARAVDVRAAGTRAIGARAAGADAQSQSQPDQAAREVRAAMTHFLDALNGLDLDAMTALFADDITAFVPTAQANRVNGKAAVSQIFRAYVDRVRSGGPAGQIEASDLAVETSGTLGIVTFNARAAGSATVRRRTFVFRRTGTRWLISHFHASDFTAP